MADLMRHPVSMMLSAARDAPQHTYVWLTKQPQNVAPFNHGAASFGRCDNWYLGLSICNQEQADAKLPAFLGIPGKRWLSLEPLWGAVDIGLWKATCDCCERRASRWIRLLGRVSADIPGEAARGYTANAGIYLAESNQHGALSVHTPGGLLGVKPHECEYLAAPQGVIVGHDNRRNAPGTDTLDHVRDVVQQCVRAGVPVFVKQLWMDTCPECSRTYPPGTAAEAEYCDDCGIGKLRPKLWHDPEAFPEDLRYRDLPWSMPTT